MPEQSGPDIKEGTAYVEPNPVRKETGQGGLAQMLELRRKEIQTGTCRDRLSKDIKGNGNYVSHCQRRELQEYRKTTRLEEIHVCELEVEVCRKSWCPIHINIKI